MDAICPLWHLVFAGVIEPDRLVLVLWIAGIGYYNNKGHFGEPIYELAHARRPIPGTRQRRSHLQLGFKLFVIVAGSVDFLVEPIKCPPRPMAYLGERMSLELFEGCFVASEIRCQ